MEMVELVEQVSDRQVLEILSKTPNHSRLLAFLWMSVLALQVLVSAFLAPVVVLHNLRGWVLVYCCYKPPASHSTSPPPISNSSTADASSSCQARNPP